MKKILYTTLNEYMSDKLILMRGVGKNLTANVDLFGRGLYLTDDLDVANFYGDTIEEYEVNGNIFDTNKPFTNIELKKFTSILDEIFTTDIGNTLLQDIINYNDGELPENVDVDYVSISWSLNSNSNFYDILKKHGLNSNEFNSYANDCTAMNMVLNKMGFVGLKYSTTEIEDLDDIGLGDKNAFVIFNKNAASKL